LIQRSSSDSTRAFRYRVRIERNWIMVPDDAVITEPNRESFRCPVKRLMHIGQRCSIKIFCDHGMRIVMSSAQ
jgi:hypothetical protein